MRTSQTKRATIFAQQNKRCALCERRGVSMAGWGYKPDQNAMICKQCNTSLGNYTSALARGVTPAMMVAFLDRGPATQEDAPTQDPECIIIDGVRCDVKTWLPID